MTGTIQRAATVVLSLTMTLCAFGPANARTITIRFLDGRNGKPITDKNINVWLHDNDHIADTWPNNAGGSHPTPNSKGELLLDLPDNLGYTMVRVSPDYRVDCRYRKDSAFGSWGPPYPLDDIVSNGLISQNMCGKIKVAPTPGVLVIFVRPRTFLELWKI